MSLRNALRPVSAVLAGLVVAHVVYFLAGFAAEGLFPTPPDLLDPQTPEETAARVEGANGGGLVLVVVGSALGGLAGGAVAGRAAGRRAVAAAALLGAMLALWGVYSFYVFYPARLWFPAGLLLCFPLFSVLGGLATARRPGP